MAALPVIFRRRRLTEPEVVVETGRYRHRAQIEQIDEIRVPPEIRVGGQRVGQNLVERADGRIERLRHIAQVEMAAGDAFVVRTPGGGGYGPK